MFRVANVFSTVFVKVTANRLSTLHKRGTEKVFSVIACEARQITVSVFGTSCSVRVWLARKCNFVERYTRLGNLSQYNR